jgi:hypothetical protein
MWQTPMVARHIGRHSVFTVELTAAEQWRDRPEASAWSPPMLNEYLWSVRNKSMPLMVEDKDADRVCALRKAGLLDADVLQFAGEALAFVTDITPAGRAELARIGEQRRCRSQSLSSRSAWSGLPAP